MLFRSVIKNAFKTKELIPAGVVTQKAEKTKTEQTFMELDHLQIPEKRNSIMEPDTIRGGTSPIQDEAVELTQHYTAQEQKDFTNNEAPDWRNAFVAAEAEIGLESGQALDFDAQNEEPKVDLPIPTGKTKETNPDRKSVVEGQSVDVGGGRVI